MSNLSPKLHHDELVAARNPRAIDLPSSYLRDWKSELFDLTPLKHDLNAGFHRNRAWDVESSVFAQFESDALAVRKTKLQSRQGEHLLFVHRYVHGRIRGRIGDLNVDRDPGAIYILDQASRVECVQSRAVMQAILVPKAIVGFDPDQFPPLLKYPGAHPIGRLLTGLFDELFATLLEDGAYDQDTYHQLIACLQLGLHNDPSHGDVRLRAREALQKQIAQFIEQNLEDEALSTDMILQNFGVSRASLYRIFQDRGGVRQYINESRLFRAVLDISAGPMRHGDIVEVSEKWGFSSSANFNRSVRRIFGVPPGGLVNLPTPDRNTLTLAAAIRHFATRTSLNAHLASLEHLVLRRAPISA